MHSHNTSTENIFAIVKDRARGHWRAVLQSHGIDQKYLSGKHSACPICGGKDRFRFDDRSEDGTFFCNNCGAGDGIKLLSLACSVRPINAAKIALSWLDGTKLPLHQIQPVRLAVPVDPDMQRQRIVQQTWLQARPVKAGDPVHRYLTETRRLNIDSIPSAVRYHPSLQYWESRDGQPARLGEFPAMIAKVQNLEGDLVNVHRTYLTSDGLKAPVSQARKLMKPATPGATNGAAIRLFQAEDVLGIAEGIETALACYASTRIPTWAAGSAGAIERLLVPHSVATVIIFADNDPNGRGEQAALKLAYRLLADGRTAKILKPNEHGDWADNFTRKEDDGQQTRC